MFSYKLLHVFIQLSIIVINQDEYFRLVNDKSFYYNMLRGLFMAEPLLRVLLFKMDKKPAPISTIFFNPVVQCLDLLLLQKPDHLLLKLSAAIIINNSITI